MPQAASETQRSPAGQGQGLQPLGMAEGAAITAGYPTTGTVIPPSPSAFSSLRSLYMSVRKRLLTRVDLPSPDSPGIWGQG